MGDGPIKIDPSAFYRDADLRLLGLADGSLARARRAGELRYTRRAGRVMYRGEWLIDWLAGADARHAPVSA